MQEGINGCFAAEQGCLFADRNVLMCGLSLAECSKPGNLTPKVKTVQMGNF